MSRPASQRLLLLVVVVAGILAGLSLIGRTRQSTRERLRQAALPDVALEHVDAAELMRHGFHLSGREPASWRDISLRLAQDERGGITCLRCTIDAQEVDRLLAWPAGSRCPVGSRPPPDWPWAAAPDRLAVPDWWQPAGGRVRSYEQAADGMTPARGIFACYDPALRLLHLWQWQRPAWRPARPSPLDHPVADMVAQALLAPLVKSTVLEGDWLQATDLPWPVLGLPVSGVAALSAAFRPLKDHHRYLLALRGVDEEQAWRLVAEQPQHPWPDDAPVPRERWGFALPPGGLPPWFAPGPGPRRIHVLVRIGSGQVEAGRWMAYDRGARTLFVWDWAEVGTQGPEVDLGR